MKRSKPLFAMLVVLFSLPALAQQSAMPERRNSAGGNPPGPPPEAYAACAGKSAGATVSFALRDGRTVQGTCALVGSRLAAQPSFGMRGESGFSADGTAPPAGGIDGGSADMQR